MNKMANKKESYFVRIPHESQTRKVLLENTRDIIKILQNYEEFKQTRVIRTDLIDSYRGQMNEIRTLIQQLKKSLPKSNIKTTKRTVIPKTISTERPTKELRKLEDELADIESKLGKL